MKIKFLTGIAGPEMAYGPGDVADIDDADAKRLIEVGFAVPARVVATVETASAAAPETAVARKGKLR